MFVEDRLEMMPVSASFEFLWKFPEGKGKRGIKSSNR